MYAERHRRPKPARGRFPFPIITRVATVLGVAIWMTDEADSRAACGAAMRITFTQSGGVIGSVKACAVDTAVLAAPDRREVESLVAASGLTESCELVAPRGRDRRLYEISIEDVAAGRPSAVLKVVCDDASVPAAARPLVAFLASRARPVPPVGEAGSA